MGLVSVPFTVDKIADVNMFHCGVEPWSMEVSKYLKDPGGALYDAQRRRCKTWLYYEGAELVGYASMGKNKWPWPSPTDEEIRHMHIVALAVQQRFQRLPEGPKELRYSYQIMMDLLAKASIVAPFVSLFVHPENARAIQFYHNVGFELLLHQTTLMDGVRYRGMVALFSEEA